jgi:hypothetical protein
MNVLTKNLTMGVVLTVTLAGSSVNSQQSG